MITEATRDSKKFAPLVGATSEVSPPPKGSASSESLEERRIRQGRNFLHQLTSGMAGWLTFEQMQRGVDNLREAEFAKPLELIARGHDYEAKGEFPLPKLEKKRGAAPRLDFLLVHRGRRITIAIEMKYKKKNKRMAGSLADDARRLHELTIDTLDAQITAGDTAPIVTSVKGYALLRALIVVWRESDIMEQMRLEPAIVRSQFKGLVMAMLPEGVEANSRKLAEAMLNATPTRPVARASGSLRPGSTYTYKRFWVACFIERPNWAKL